MYQIVNSRIDKKDGKIFHELPNGEQKIYRTISAGITWPKPPSPGYFCVFGQYPDQNEFSFYPTVFLLERESKKITALFRQLVDFGKMYKFSEVYADLEGSCQCFVDSFHDYLSETNSSGIYLSQAPWVENFAFGLALIQEWLDAKALEIPLNTLLAKQLGTITEESLINNPEIPFYGVNALRHVINRLKRFGVITEEMEVLDFNDIYALPGYYRFQ